MNSPITPPKVSVCMIAYKHDAYIRQAIESILSQEVDFPLELVIGDDFSPDCTAAICEEFALRDPRVHVLPRERPERPRGAKHGLRLTQRNLDWEAPGRRRREKAHTGLAPRRAWGEWRVSDG